MTVEQAFGTVLRELRSLTGKSQETVALDAGLDRTYISMLERGLRQPTLGTVLALSRPLGVSASEVFARVEAQFDL
ncbi:MAG: helix-turn-helix transcriptional regulator [Proteobacteria bacterium]|nr:helix-turn-helix transcriptional regulator [Pseudomonadota bacterium]